MDVLNAQGQLIQTQASLARARSDVLLGALKLRQAGGVLTAERRGQFKWCRMIAIITMIVSTS